MSAPLAAYLDGDQNGRLHLQHGPIDLVIGVDGAISLELESYFRTHAYAMANRRFRTILDELVQELPLLKSRAFSGCPMPRSAVALRMMAAVLPLSEEHFITPMAAVAGAVADEVLAAMVAGFKDGERPSRIYVNNGGDIALHLDAGAEFRIGIDREDGASLGQFAIAASETVRGVATSGRGGRSLSMGIADSVTVLAQSAAAADAAASIVGNAVDLPGHPGIRRAPANSVVDDSDLGEWPVVIGCDALSDDDMAQALDAGVARTLELNRRGLVARAALFLGHFGRIAPDRPLVQDTNTPLPADPIRETKRYA